MLVAVAEEGPVVVATATADSLPLRLASASAPLGTLSPTLLVSPGCSSNDALTSTTTTLI